MQLSWLIFVGADDGCRAQAFCRVYPNHRGTEICGIFNQNQACSLSTSLVLKGKQGFMPQSTKKILFFRGLATFGGDITIPGLNGKCRLTVWITKRFCHLTFTVTTVGSCGIFRKVLIPFCVLSQIGTKNNKDFVNTNFEKPKSVQTFLLCVIQKKK